MMTGAFTAAMVFSVQARRFPLSAQTRDTSAAQKVEDSLQQVADFSELRPGTASERTRAEYFNKPFISGSLLEIVRRGGGGRSYGHSDGFGGTSNSDVTFGDGKPQTASEALRSRVCSSDAVVLGRTEARKALLTVSESWLFTDYTFAVADWLHPSNEKPQPSITVSVSGGEVRVGDVTLRVVEGRPTPVLAVPASYVLFLKTIKNADAFQLMSGAPIKLTASMDQIRTDSTGLLRSIREAGESCSQLRR
jgi:hypothetical protein